VSAQIYTPSSLSSSVVAHLTLLSFPTRRSSDLDVAVTLPVTNVSVAGSRGPAADAPVAAQQPAQDCQILHLEFGGVTLDVLGIMLQLSPITLDLNLGGVLGGILCGLLGALAGGAPAQAQAGILNAALGSAP